MADSTIRGLERKATEQPGCANTFIALAKARARSGICPKCQASPACYLFEGDGDDDEGMRACRSALPTCEDCEGDRMDDRCNELGDGDGHLEDCRCDPCSRCEGSGKDPYGIVIDGETHSLETTQALGYSDGDLWQLSSGGRGAEYIVAIDADDAGKAARERWESMASDDPSEFTAMVGETTLVAWALGQSAGPGSTQVSSLSEWLDLWLDTPEEEWAGYDGVECEVTETGSSIRDEIGFSPSVAYRSN